MTAVSHIILIGLLISIELTLLIYYLVKNFRGLYVFRARTIRIKMLSIILIITTFVALIIIIFYFSGVIIEIFSFYLESCQVKILDPYLNLLFSSMIVILIIISILLLDKKIVLKNYIMIKISILLIYIFFFIIFGIFWYISDLKEFLYSIYTFQNVVIALIIGGSLSFFIIILLILKRKKYKNDLVRIFFISIIFEIFLYPIGIVNSASVFNLLILIVLDFVVVHYKFKNLKFEYIFLFSSFLIIQIESKMPVFLQLILFDVRYIDLSRIEWISVIPLSLLNLIFITDVLIGRIKGTIFFNLKNKKLLNRVIIFTFIFSICSNITFNYNFIYSRCYIEKNVIYINSYEILGLYAQNSSISFLCNKRAEHILSNYNNNLNSTIIRLGYCAGDGNLQYFKENFENLNVSENFQIIVLDHTDLLSTYGQYELNQILNFVKEYDNYTTILISERISIFAYFSISESKI
ncbi:MAG: hypothetical protein ACTSRP_18675 [Candidatus Helarchaeota archaeon]